MQVDGLMERQTNQLQERPVPAVESAFLAKMDDEAFENHMALVRRYWSKTPADKEIFRREEPLRRRLRELDRSGGRRSSAAKSLLRSLNNHVSAKTLIEETTEIFVSYCIALLLIIVWMGTKVAFDASEGITSRCSEGTSFAGFDMTGQHVQLFDSTTQAQKFTERELILLGGDANRYVLYDCKNHATLRIPTAGIIVVH